jgi:excisionase family DNA binding protein
MSHTGVQMPQRGRTSVIEPRTTADRADRELLTAEEVAALLGIGVDWVWEQARKGRIPHIRLGRFRRFRRQAIEEWLEAIEISVGNDRARR